MRSNALCGVELVKLARSRINRERVPIRVLFNWCVVGYAIWARIALGGGLSEPDIGHSLVRPYYRVFIPVRGSEVRVERVVSSHRFDVQARAGIHREGTET